MKNANEITYVTCPITMMATIIHEAENNFSFNYQKEADRMIKYYNSLLNYSDLVICDVSFSQLMAEDELGKMLNFVLHKIDYVQSFTTNRLNNETTIFKLNCAQGNFRMILVIDADNKITAIDFSREESMVMNNAA